MRFYGLFHMVVVSLKKKSYICHLGSDNLRIPSFILFPDLCALQKSAPARGVAKCCYGSVFLLFSCFHPNHAACWVERAWKQWQEAEECKVAVREVFV